MIKLSWRRSGTSQSDRGSLAKAIGQIIPMVLGWHKAVAVISKDIKIETRLILK